MIAPKDLEIANNTMRSLLLPYIEEALFDNFPELAVMEDEDCITQADPSWTQWQIPCLRVEKHDPAYLTLDYKNWLVSIGVQESDFEKIRGDKEKASQLYDAIKSIALITTLDVMRTTLYGDGNKERCIFGWDGIPIAIDDGEKYPTYAGIDRILPGGRKAMQALVVKNYGLPTLPNLAKLLILNQSYLLVTSQDLFSQFWSFAPRHRRKHRGDKSNPTAQLGFDAIAISSDKRKIHSDLVWSQGCPDKTIYIWPKHLAELQFINKSGEEYPALLSWSPFIKEQQRYVGRFEMTGNFFFSSPHCIRVDIQ